MTGIGNTNFFYPSQIEDNIYSIMEDYEIGISTYSSNLEAAVIEYLQDISNHDPHFQNCLQVTNWPDMTGGCVSLSWVESGILHMIGWDFKYD